jgi:site-specific recombinase XerD
MTIQTQPPPVILKVMQDFLDMVKRSRSPNTVLSYAKGISFFAQVLGKHQISVEKTTIDQLTEDAIPWLLDALKDYSPATEQLYTVAVKRFYNFLSAHRLSEVNTSRLNEFILQQSRRTGRRLPQFPREAIEKVLGYIQQPPSPTESVSTEGDERRQPKEASETEKLRWLRDRAFLLTLADTGLRVNEACSLRRGDIDWNEGRAVIIGKGDKQAVVRFSTRSMNGLRDYLSARSPLDGASGRPLSALPLFARHDKGAGKKVKPMTTATGRNIVDDRVRQALGGEAEGRITPHSFRHYFVTTVLRASGNLKLAQELARHANISVTQRYAHISDDELDKGYHEIFENNATRGDALK